MTSKLCTILSGCLFACIALAQESQPTSQASTQPSSAPASSPASAPTSLPGPVKVIDPWSGAEIKLTKTDPKDLKSPRKAHMLAWLSFGGGLAISAIGAGSLVGIEPEKSKAPAISLLGIGGALSVVGPSLGHFYAGETKLARRRSLVALLIVGGAATASVAVYQAASALEDQPVRITMSLLPMTFAGAYELWYAVQMAEDAPQAVKRTNEKRAKQISIAPDSDKTSR